MNKVLVISLSALIPLVINPLFSVFMGLPVPRSLDEFGYLLVADTFCHGRITNPVHPCWENMQTFNQTEIPTRTGITAPLLSVFMAFGQYFFNLPILGTWICIALMTAAIAWMLYGWTRPVWALLGTILAFLNLSCYTYWSHTYWGGAAPALAGAIIFGALPRMYRNPSLRNAVLTGVGCTLLANSRPLEGFLCCLPVAGVFVMILARPDLTLRFKCTRIILPISVLFALMLIQIGYYNKTITGTPLKFPEAKIMEENMSTPLFVWQKLPKEPVYSSEFYRTAARQFSQSYYQTKTSSFSGFMHWVRWELEEMLNFFFGPILGILFLFSLPFFIMHRWYRFAALTALGLILFDTVGLAVMTQPNYVAPVSCLLYLLAATAFRLIWVTRILNRRIGRIVFPLLLTATVIWSFSNILIDRGRPAFRPWKSVVSSSPLGMHRAALIKNLRNTGEKHLILVRYGANHAWDEEWVYNGADIDESPVVFAHDMNNADNKKIIDYFKGRKIWLLDVYRDDQAPRIFPFITR